MKKPLITAIAIAAALPLMLSGCASETPKEDTSTGAETTGTTNDTSPVRDAETLLSELKSAGDLPADFPKTTDLRVETDGDSFAVAWKGDRLTNDCVAAEGSPNDVASILLIADGTLEDVQQCGDVWQAVQVDGSNIAWN